MLDHQALVGHLCSSQKKTLFYFFKTIEKTFLQMVDELGAISPHPPSTQVSRIKVKDLKDCFYLEGGITKVNPAPLRLTV